MIFKTYALPVIMHQWSPVDVVLQSDQWHELDFAQVRATHHALNKMLSLCVRFNSLYLSLSLLKTTRHTHNLLATSTLVCLVSPRHARIDRPKPGSPPPVPHKRSWGRRPGRGSERRAARPTRRCTPCECPPAALIAACPIPAQAC